MRDSFWVWGFLNFFFEYKFGDFGFLVVSIGLGRV